jgi:nitrate/nitrite-specific signal transduction histidine kinase
MAVASALLATLVGASDTALLKIRERSAEDAARDAVVGGVTGAVGSLLLLAHRYVTRVVAGPVRRAAQMAKRISRDDLAARVPETRTGEMAGSSRP